MVVQKNLWLVLQIFLVVGVGRLYSRGGDRNIQRNQETLMDMPLLLQDRMLAEVHRQIRAAVNDREMDYDDFQVTLWELCLAPWEVGLVFRRPYAEIADLMDRYDLKAIATSWDYVMAIGPPDIPDWNKGFYRERVVPLYSPHDVWKAWLRHQNGDVGVAPPPVACESDEVLRSIWRKWSTHCENLDSLIAMAHDADLIAAALSPEVDAVESRIAELAKQHGIWMTENESLEGQAPRYWNTYGETPLSRLRTAYGLPTDVNIPRCRWVSPTIIPLIESCEEFRDRTTSPQWLLYKAVTVHKGELPEEQHNLMTAAAIADCKYAKDYFDFLKPPPEPVVVLPEPVDAPPEPDYEFLEELRRLDSE
jgi:hypothetical protein